MKKFNAVIAAFLLFAGLAQANVVREGDVLHYLVVPANAPELSGSKLDRPTTDSMITDKLSALVEAQRLEMSRDLDSKINLKFASLVK